MTFRINTNSCKNALGTVFLLAAAFFVCSTLVSMRSVFADPIAPVDTTVKNTGRQSPRSTSRTAKKTVSRNSVATKVLNKNTNSATVSSRSASNGRTVASRSTSRSLTPTRTSTSTSNRTVTSRLGTSTNTRNTARSVKSRSATNSSRVSATGSVMSTGVSRSSTGTTYSYLTSSLYTGNYSNIIDSSTGLISSDAYSNCMSSYYTCMDEICTARSDTKGRCSCAGRATNFLEAEEALEKANEELITLSGQLSLLISTKGKGDELAAAFSLTEAEEVMNCVSWKETVTKYGSGSQEVKDWCTEHNIAESKCSQPTYCTSNNYGFDIEDIDGSSSDILSQLQAWADAKDLAKQFTSDDTDSLLSNYTSISSAVSSLVNNLSSDSTTETSDLDSLASKWGYELFEYAHNNVCGRVLDSCFNGIYEACGTPPSVTESDGTKHTKCVNGNSSNCPYNYNSYISVDSDGDITLNERGSTNATTTSTASCFGYSTTSTTTTTRTVTTTSDPYSSLRGPVADARRSIMQKYLLDANAACDTYGTALKETAQNINYQKIAAKQSLQAKRLEFAQEEEETRLSDATTAIDNFNECISEIWDCYEEYEDEDNWTTARIKAYCSQVSQVPHCYETMICSPLQSQLTAVIDLSDDTECKFTNDYKTNTCRNVVTISEILYNTGTAAATATASEDTTANSAALRENCLESALSCSSTDSEGCLRTWTKPQ